MNKKQISWIAFWIILAWSLGFCIFHYVFGPEATRLFLAWTGLVIICLILIFLIFAISSIYEKLSD